MCTKKEKIVHIHVLTDLLDFVPSVSPKFIHFVCVFLSHIFAVLVTLLQLPLYVDNFAVAVFPIPISGYCPFLHGDNSIGTSR